MTGYYAYKCLKDNLTTDYIILGIVAALGFLSKYLFIYLLIGLKIFYIFFLKLFSDNNDRSHMNATFNLADGYDADLFKSICSDKNISGINVHRSVGGFRAYI